MTPVQPARRSGRAPALPPDERRQAILDAVAPLLLSSGTDLTTRQLATAAGVAEGTLFRVFEDKAALLRAAATTALDPARTRSALAEVDPGLDLPGTVHAAAELMLTRSAQVLSVLMGLRGQGGLGGTHEHAPPGPPPAVRASHDALLEGLAELLARHRSELRVPPERAALVLRALVMGSGRPWTDEQHRLTADEITEVLLMGLRRDEGRPGC